jgi:demethylmenaquinone methyltransferase / 2-methoxy-6-polyprenyl-1,4-benzoquinol methylase
MPCRTGVTPQDVGKSPTRIASMFDAIAGRYDFLNHLLSGGVDRWWRRAAIRSLRLRGHERLLDVCTGTADLAIAAASSWPSAARVVGVDFAGAMLAVGRDKLRARRLGSPTALVRGDATALPVATGAVDALTVAFGIRNVEQPAVACGEMFRVMRQGARLAILEFAIPTLPVFRQAYLAYFRFVLPAVGRIVSRHSAAYGYLPASVGAFATPDEFVKILRQAGFIDVRAVPLTLGIVYLYTAVRP